jgi:hypothetical protein
LLLEIKLADKHYFPIATHSVQSKERTSYVEVMSVLLPVSCYHPITIGHIFLKLDIEATDFHVSHKLLHRVY